MSPSPSRNILVFGEGISLAHVTRALLVGRELARRGHRVSFATADRYRAWVEARSPGNLEVHTVYTPDARDMYARQFTARQTSARHVSAPAMLSLGQAPVHEAVGLPA